MQFAAGSLENSNPNKCKYLYVYTLIVQTIELVLQQN